MFFKFLVFFQMFFLCFFLGTGIQPDEKTQILETHNRLRSSVAQGRVPNQPGAENMREMVILKIEDSNWSVAQFKLLFYVYCFRYGTKSWLQKHNNGRISVPFNMILADI